MNLDKKYKEMLIKEIKFVLKKMKEEKEPKEKLYYFSAIFGIMHRIYNLEYSSDLVFTHFVLSSVHSQINSRIQMPESTVKFPDDLFQKLEENTRNLLNAIEKNENLYEVLMKYSVLGYVTIGNGYYLYQKGQLKL